MSKSNEWYDWDSIRQEYITTKVSLKELAEKHGCRMRTMAGRCADEGWVQQRMDFKVALASKTVEKTAEKLAENQSDILARVLKCADVGIDKALTLLEGDVKAIDLERIVNSLRVIEELARSIQGILTVQQEHKIFIEKERLKMDQQKTEAFNPDSEIVIKVEGSSGDDVREWAM